jgi:hypothetical protein
MDKSVQQTFHSILRESAISHPLLLYSGRMTADVEEREEGRGRIQHLDTRHERVRHVFGCFS